MFCPSCGVSCEPGQKFCSNCGSSLHVLTPSPQLITPVVPPPSIDESISIVEQTDPLAAAPFQWDAGWSTDEASASSETATTDPTPAGLALSSIGSHSRMSAVVAGLSILAGTSTIVASFLVQLTLKSDAPIAETLGNYKLNDLTAASAVEGLFSGTNLQMGVIVIGALMVLGGVLSVVGKPFGNGLAAGAALALAPVVVVVWGNISKLSDAAVLQAQDAKNVTNVGTFVDTGPTFGFYLLVGASALALIAVVAFVARATVDTRAPFNTVICTAGALASAVAAAGQLIPANGARFDDNFNTSSFGLMLVSGRLAIIGLVAIGGVVGFLRRNRWGIALALGTVGFYAWQWLSSIAKLGDFPAEPAFGHPGSMHVRPHLATTIGLITMLVLAAVTIATTARKSEGQP